MEASAHSSLNSYQKLSVDTLPPIPYFNDIKGTFQPPLLELPSDCRIGREH